FASVRVGINRIAVFRYSFGQGENWPEKLGVKGVLPDAFPRFNISSGLVPTANFGTPGNQSRRAGFLTSEVNNDFTLMRGAHTIKVGG
ncbi:MAG: hypothetical protein JNL62_26250, partial [Bryobacterales bacterium]|nr:hypothetical protein [Bryobacterales bacterium]